MSWCLRKDKAGRHPCSERNCELPIDDGDGFPSGFSAEINRLGFGGFDSDGEGARK